MRLFFLMIAGCWAVCASCSTEFEREEFSCEESAAGVEVIVDNLDPDFHTEIGTWEACECTACEGQCWGEDFFYAAPRPAGVEVTTARAVFTPNLPVCGTYEVSMWWPRGSDRATDAPVFVRHATGEDDMMVSLRGGEGWYPLGTYEFKAGREGYVAVEDSASGYVNADAVRFSGIR